ncbi:5-oxoprolinase subunit C family protein [Sutcliffiella cohnii]|uniref:5-oxoprolinase subunit C family protein n=1 Tax=Sutcliffiella sp. NC1 TaxID=3004096 RepID=UPI0022DD79FB|nr:biotin-dependent carboxyltransferase family protein [Sutcliffiella sp. NC1]WBL15010.1 biotin-dependent carboxyltransferase family protein [Sutcliffiella sp. NC1]
MTYPLFIVKKKGLLTSFQDSGRLGYQAKGVVVSGVMDSYSFEQANRLVGNVRNEACMEMGLIGPTLQLLADEAMIAVCGANINPRLNGVAFPMWKSIKVQKGDVLSFPGTSEGIYAYLAVRGGFSVVEVLGSKSYYNKANIGTAIHDGDTLYGQKLSTYRNRFLSKKMIPSFPKEQTVRVIPGPHEKHFTNDSLQRFFSTTYTVKQTDRMGARLDGQPLEVVGSGDISSDAIPFGGIQVPRNGLPLVLLADRQTTGGYPRIGTIIKADIRKLAQLPPGGKIRFQRTTLEEAYKLNSCSLNTTTE